MTKIKYDFEGISNNMNKLSNKESLLSDISKIISSLNIDDAEINSSLQNAKVNTDELITEILISVHDRILKTHNLCEDYLKVENSFELELPLASDFISIPKEFGNSGKFSYTVINDIKWDSNFDPAKVYDKWIESGSTELNSIATIDDRYLIACTSTYGNIGDKINFYLDDGTVIKGIMMDEKAQVYCDYDHNPANKWGHLDGQQIVEFEITNVVNDSGNVGTWMGIDGRSVVSALNTGENILTNNEFESGGIG